MKKLLLCLFLLSVLIGCITDFTPDVQSVRGILVVDGMICDGVSEFRLSRSVGILDDLVGEEGIMNAEMVVERSDGVLFPAIHVDGGAYKIETGTLVPDLEYRLTFSIDGVRYESSFLKPVQTVEIDSISYQKAGWEKPVTVHVSSHARDDQSPYYRWSYRETWEVTATLFATLGYMDGKLISFDRNTSANTYYCWGRDSSKVMLLGNTKRLSENKVAQQKLFEIPSNDDRLSVLYHVEVSQMQLREEAYDYYQMMMDEIERTGGLFNMVMSAGDNGNIYNVSDPEEIVIGYVEVSNVTTKSRYIPFSDNLYEGGKGQCPVWTIEIPGGSYPWVTSTTYSTWRCVDCRMRYNATKNKPSWWPTDHL